MTKEELLTRLNDIEWDDERCILRREIAPAGRSRAFINDSPVPLSKLEEVGHAQGCHSLVESVEDGVVAAAGAPAHALSVFIVGGCILCFFHDVTGL